LYAVSFWNFNGFIKLRNQSRNSYDCDMPRETRNSKEISAYYDSLTDEAREEERLWAEFAETQFSSDLDCELPRDLSSSPDGL